MDEEIQKVSAKIKKAKLAEAIIKFFSGEKLAKSLREGALDTSKKYDLAESVSLLEKTYEGLQK